MSVIEFLNFKKLEKGGSDNFFLRVCAFILLARLFISLFFNEEYVYVQEALSNLIITGVIFVLSLMFIVKKYLSGEKLGLSPLDYPIWMLSAAMGLSLISSVNLSVSLNFTLVFISYVFLFYILFNVIKNEQQLKTIGSYFLVCVAVLVIFGIWEYFVLKDPEFLQKGSHGILYKRIGSLFGLPNLLAGFLMMAIPLVWAGVVITENIWQKRGMFLLMIVSLLVFLSTFSFLSSVNFMMTTVILSPLILKEWLKKPAGKTSFLVIVSGVLIFFVFIIFLRKDISILSRLDYLSQASFLIKANPWWGTGADTFSIVSTKYVSYLLGYSSYVHNSYLQFWVETGILGFLAVISLVGAFAFHASKSLKNESLPQRRVILIALIWGLSAFFVDNLTNFTMLRPNIALFWWAVLATFYAFINQQKDLVPQKLLYRDRVFLILLLIAISIFLLTTIKLSFALLSYKNGVIHLTDGHFDSAQLAFEKSEGLDPLNSQYPWAIGSVNIRRYLSTHDIKYLKAAEEDFIRSALLSPHSHKIYLTLSGLAQEQGDILMSEKYLEQASRLSPLTYRNSPVSIQSYNKK